MEFKQKIKNSVFIYKIMFKEKKYNTINFTLIKRYFVIMKCHGIVLEFIFTLYDVRQSFFKPPPISLFTFLLLSCVHNTHYPMQTYQADKASAARGTVPLSTLPDKHLDVKTVGRSLVECQHVVNTYKMNITHLYSLFTILIIECLKPGSVQATDACQDMEASLQCYSDNWESLQCFFLDSGAACIRNVSMKVNHHL